MTEVAECCSIDFSTVSRHLGALARVGVLNAEKQGRTMWYSAPGNELAERFRAIADAIEEWACDVCDDECGEGCC